MADVRWQRSRHEDEELRVTVTERQKVYDALDGFSDAFYLFILSVIRPLNRFIANTIADDPTPAQRLEDAIAAEYARLGVSEPD